MLSNPIRRTQTKITLRIVLLLGIILLVGGFLKTQLIDKSSLKQAVISDFRLDKQEAVADGQDYAKLETVLTEKDDSPFVGALVGLYIPEENLRSEAFSYHDWYSENGQQAFKVSNQEGEVSFQIKSDLTGSITYQIYQAHPERQDQLKYQPLGEKFTVHFVESSP